MVYKYKEKGKSIHSTTILIISKSWFFIFIEKLMYQDYNIIKYISY